jgi:hypothetical protein
MVLSETSKSSIESSPWIRGAPHVGFSATILKIRSRTSFEIRFLPNTWRALEIARQQRANPARCDRATVSGVTMIRACFQSDQNLRARIQKCLSNKLGLGLGFLRLNAASCCRSTKLSSNRLDRDRKTRRMLQERSCKIRSIHRCYRKEVVNRKGLCC